MTTHCSICLSSFKEPVCIPCGHIYCKDCLAGHVNAPNNESMKASCPTCRASFSLATPDLAFLPKKYHEWIMPNVRRVYLDSTRQNDLEKKIKKLVKDQEILMKECERHMAAARAQAEGEKAAQNKAAILEMKLQQTEKKLHESNARAHMADRCMIAEKALLRREVDELKENTTRLRKKYEALKKLHAGHDERSSSSLGRRRDNESEANASSSSLFPVVRQAIDIDLINRSSRIDQHNSKRLRLSKIGDVYVREQASQSDSSLPPGGSTRPVRPLPRNRHGNLLKL